MKVAEASICLDCDSIFETKEHTLCPECSRSHHAPLRKYLKPLSEAKSADELAVEQNFKDDSGD